MNNLDKLVDDAVREHTARELALGFLRYEALRKLTPHKFKTLWERATLTRAGGFDDLVDEILKGTKP